MAHSPPKGSSGAVFVAALHLMIAVFGATPSSYRAATTMHFPTWPSPDAQPRDVHIHNLIRYTALAHTAFEGQADIIVFPESGTGYLMVPDASIRSYCEAMPAVGWSSSNCPAWDVFRNFTGVNGTEAAILASFLQQSTLVHASWASCAAQALQMDIVFNFGYYDVLTDKYYNANAIFLGKQGMLIGIYRKSHINAVPYLTQPRVADPVVFTSSFGVTFGTGVCYDLWFHEPWKMEMERGNITNFVYPNGMGSLSPLETIDQLHAGFSLVHGVNFISSALFSTGGAGAFHQGQVLGINPLMPFLNTPSNVIVSEVPLIRGPPKPFSTAPRRRVVHPQKDEGSAIIEGQPCFNGSATCAVFPTNTPTTVYLAASYQGPFGNVSCTATVVTTSPSNLTWMLAASQLDMVPASAGTPDTNEASFCMVMQCADVKTGCAFGAPFPELWYSDLNVQSVTVEAQFGGGMQNSSDLLFFPIYGLFNGSQQGNASDTNWQFPLVFPNATTSVYASRPATNIGSGSSFVFVMDGPDVATQKLFSAGIYVAKKGATWPNEA